MEEDFAKLRAVGHAGLRLHHLQVDAWDQRSARGDRLADADNVGAMIAFFREWLHAAKGGEPPSLLVHCMQGQYRSGSAALIAHNMLTGAPCARPAPWWNAGRNPASTPTGRSPAMPTTFSVSVERFTG